VIARFVAPSALWLDEAQSVAIARLPLPQLFDGLRQDGSPPLYYLLLHVWTAVVGTGSFAVRALSGLLSLLTLWLAWRLTRRLAGARVAGALVLLLAASPFAIRYASETRMYALVLLLTVLGGMAASAVAQRSGPWPVVALGVVTGALLLTHYWAVHLVVVAVVVALAQLRRHRRTGLRLLAGLGLGVAAFLPWVPSLLVQLAHTGTPWAAVRPWTVFQISFGAWQGGGDVLPWLLGLLLDLLVVVGVLAVPGRQPAEDGELLLRLRVSRSRALLLTLSLGTLLVAALASVASSSAVSGRYSTVAFLPFLALAALGIAALPSRRARGIALGLAALLGLAGSVPGMIIPRSQAGQVAHALSAAAPGDVVLFCPDQLGPAVSRLAPPGLDLVVYPDLRSADRVDWTDYAQRVNGVSPVSVASAVLQRAGSHGIWVAWSDVYRVPSAARCRSLVESIAAVRGEPRLVFGKRPQVLENERLLYFPLPAGTGRTGAPAVPPG
jgi:4-amino-4-deoxy-L-arabinose transferase-like glycosyltransferase